MKYSNANFKQLRKYFGEIDWSELFGTNDTEEKWTKFLDIYNEGVKKWVPKRSTKDLAKKKEWYNRRGTDTRLEKEEAWEKERKNKRHDLWTTYVRKRNEYVRICRTEQRNYERSIVDKCKDQPKLFYKFINGKLKTREDITKVKVEGKLLK